MFSPRCFLLKVGRHVDGRRSLTEHAVRKHETTVCCSGNSFVVRDDDDGNATTGHVAEIIDNAGGVHRVQVAGWFIGEQDPGGGSHGSCDRKSLTFASRQKPRLNTGSMGKTELPKCLADRVAVVILVPQGRWEDDRVSYIADTACGAVLWRP